MILDTMREFKDDSRKKTIFIIDEVPSNEVDKWSQVGLLKADEDLIIALRPPKLKETSKSMN